MFGFRRSEASPRGYSYEDEGLNPGEAALQDVVNKRGNLTKKDKPTLLVAIDYVSRRIKGIEKSVSEGLGAPEDFGSSNAEVFTTLENLQRSLADLEAELGKLK